MQSCESATVVHFSDLYRYVEPLGTGSCFALPPASLQAYAAQKIEKLTSLWHILATDISTTQTPRPDISFKDHFSGHAGSYAAHRPSYPESLFAFLATLCDRHELAWDCATGNGQAARSLTPFFEKVVATDASDQQIGSADAHRKIEFRVAPAESSGIDAESVDMITVAQALHWFDIERFFDEARRVLKSGGVLAFWSYERCLVDPACDDAIEKVFAEVEPYWPPERDIVEDHYRSITMPLPEIAIELFEMQVDWTADDMLSYMRTWSATQRYMQANGSDPVALYARELKVQWGSGKRDVRWPLTLKVGGKRHRVCR